MYKWYQFAQRTTDYDLKIRSTKEHGNTDILSRLPGTVKSELPVGNIIYSLQIDMLPVTVNKIQTETSNGKVSQKVLKYLKDNKWPDHITDEIKPYYNKRNELAIEERN